MSETNISTTTTSPGLTQAQVTTYIAELQAILKVASIAASFSPNKSGVQLIANLEAFLTQVSAAASNPALLGVVNGIITLVQSGNLASLLATLEAALGVAPSQ